MGEREREMALAITTNLRREAARLHLVEPSCLSRSRTSAFASTSAANSSAPALKISNGVSTRKTQSCSSTRRQLLCRSQKEEESQVPPEIANDVWADEKFNILGLLFQNIWVVAILLTGLAGGLAAKSYNDGATSFLQKPINQEDQARIISLEELQKARNLPQAEEAASPPPAAEAPPATAD